MAAAAKHLLEMSNGQLFGGANPLFMNMNPLSLPVMSGINFSSNSLPFFNSLQGGSGKPALSPPYSSPGSKDQSLNQSQSSSEENDRQDMEDTMGESNPGSPPEISSSRSSSSRVLGHRNQKRPIPNEQKDGKYFERRRRNNLAAKKSRDARKTREDQLAMRVAHLEKENAIFRAQVAILREEMSVLQLYLCQKASGNFPNSEKNG